MSWRRFELSEGSSHEFWEVGVSGSAFRVRFGRIGTGGQELEKSCASPAAARAAADRLLAERR